MKKIFSLILILIILTSVLCACRFIYSPDNKPDDGSDSTKPTPTPELTQSKAEITAPVNRVKLYNNANVKVEGETLPLYSVKVNNEHSWQPNPTTSRSDAGVGYMFLEGKAQVSVEADGMTNCVVRPLSANVTATVTNGVANFSIASAGNYVIEPNGNPEQAIMLFVSDYGKRNPIASTSNVIRFAKGIHTSSNSNYISNNTVTLSSNTTVILEEGAVVRAKFVANNANNITICGTGIIDGSTFVRNATTNEVTVPLDFNYCSNVTFKDFSVLDPAGWGVNWYFCNDCNIDGIKIISSRSNGDGISIQSCKRINVSNCFVRTWDDNLVVKNYPQWSNRDNEGATEDITFSDCVLWTDLAQSMEVGYETVGKVMKNITFKNITVLHNFHKPVMSIHNGNNADITNVTFDGITVEDASMGRGDAGSNNQLCEIAVEFSSTWSTQHKTTALGSISGVTVRNVTVLDGNQVITFRLAGCRDTRSGYGGTTHKVTGVKFENVWLQGKQLSSSYAYLTKNEYVSLSVKEGNGAVIVPFQFSLSTETLNSYTDSAQVSVH